MDGLQILPRRPLLPFVSLGCHLIRLQGICSFPWMTSRRINRPAAGTKIRRIWNTCHNQEVNQTANTNATFDGHCSTERGK